MRTDNTGLGGRVALVAGGTGGIGRAVASLLAGRGAAVIVGGSKSIEAAAHVAEEIMSSGGRAEPVLLDVTSPDNADRVCEDIYSRYGRLDILVNSAGINRESPALGMDDATWSAVVETNLGGAHRLCRAAAKYMLLGRWGRIINVSSISGTRGGRGQANYAASKAGLEALTRVLALELGRKGITANCVAPGVIDTAMTERIRDEHPERILESISLRRTGRPEEVAEAVCFLASGSASYINGHVLRVDGGMML